MRLLRSRSTHRWGAIFELHKGEDYTWRAQKVDNAYADPMMKLVVHPATDGTIACGAILATAFFLIFFESTHLIGARWKVETQATWRFGTMALAGYLVGVVAESNAHATTSRGVGASLRSLLVVLRWLRAARAVAMVLKTAHSGAGTGAARQLTGENKSAVFIAVKAQRPNNRQAGFLFFFRFLFLWFEGFLFG